VEHGIRTIAFPAISCGVYGYPVNQAAAIAIEEVMQYPAFDGCLQQITFVCFNEIVLKAYCDALAQAAA
jgi:O-acetyl-ADP-ribose deacetylase (regulator of RNase III)